MSESISLWLEALQDRYFVARVTAARAFLSSAFDEAKLASARACSTTPGSR